MDKKCYGKDSRSLMATLNNQSVETRQFWNPRHCQKTFEGYFSSVCPVAPRVYREGDSLPSSVGLPAQDQARVLALAFSYAR